MGCVCSGGMSTSDENEWTANPRLKEWTAARQAAFEEWAAETGGEWDFTMESVDRLEALIRDRFASSSEVEAAQDTPFVQGAYWYLGEVFVRVHQLEWQQRPGAPPTTFRLSSRGAAVAASAKTTKRNWLSSPLT